MLCLHVFSCWQSLAKCHNLTQQHNVDRHLWFCSLEIKISEQKPEVALAENFVCLLNDKNIMSTIQHQLEQLTNNCTNNDLQMAGKKFHQKAMSECYLSSNKPRDFFLSYGSKQRTYIASMTNSIQSIYHSVQSAKNLCLIWNGIASIWCKGHKNNKNNLRGTHIMIKFVQ